MATTLAQVLRHFGPAYLRTHDLSAEAAGAWRAIVACRTPALGGQRWRCQDCGVDVWRWHSCRNRHCPQCQAREREAWRAARLAELLDVPYCHLVFTLPHELNALAGGHKRWVYETLMQCVAATLTTFAADTRWLGGIGSFTLVLHTWTQDLRRHLHVHALMACGALDGGGRVWVEPKKGPRFLFPVRALSKVFRGKFCEALAQAQAQGRLPRDTATPPEQARRLDKLQATDWVVYAKTPLAGPAAVLDYLSRYTHRNAIGNERLVAIKDEQLLLKVRDNEHGGKRRVVAIEGEEFIGRLMLHVLPKGFKRIRHYGLLAPAAKAKRLEQARAALAMPQANPLAKEQVAEFMRRVAGIEIGRCPQCGGGRWQLHEQRVADRQALAMLPQRTVDGQPNRGCRGPP